MFGRSGILGLLTVVTAACGAPENATLRMRVDSLRIALDSLTWKVDRNEIEFRLATERFSEAIFDPVGDRGFQRIDSQTGSFAVSVQDVRPYGDGVEVTLHVGNLTTATFNGGKVKVKWGSRMPAFRPPFSEYRAWQARLNEKEIPFTDDLQQGTWNTVKLVLPGTPPTEFGYLTVAIETDRISLRR